MSEALLSANRLSRRSFWARPCPVTPPRSRTHSEVIVPARLPTAAIGALDGTDRSRRHGRVRSSTRRPAFRLPELRTDVGTVDAYCNSPPASAAYNLPNVPKGPRGPGGRPLHPRL